MATQSPILKFYEKVARSRDGLEYLDLFRRLHRGRLAVLFADAATVSQDAETLCESLAYLGKLRLFFPVVFDPGPGADAAATMELGRKLADMVGKFRIRAEMFDSPLDLPTRAQDGGWIVTTERMLQLCKDKTFPLLGPLARAGSQLRCFAPEAWSLYHALAVKLHPAKGLILSPTGGFHQKEGGEIISKITLLENHIPEMDAPSLGLWDRFRPLLHELGEDFAVQVTSAAQLLPELFTEKGQGSFLTLGYMIQEAPGWGSVDQAQFENLIRASFGKTLIPGYFNNPVEAVLLEEHYHGAAVLARGPHTLYLDKLAVHPDKQNRGLARQLFNSAQRKAGDKLFWRASIQNPINIFYFRVCHRFERVGEWNLFARGLNDAEWRQAREFVKARPGTLMPLPDPVEATTV